MRGFYTVLGFPIEKETACKTSGNHPFCRRCRALGQKEGNGRPSRGIPQEKEPTRTKRRRRCECGQAFIPRGNAQIRCDRCGKARAALKNREYQSRFRKNRRNGLGVRVLA